MINKLIEIIETPMKASVTTIAGLITGYVPTTVNNMSNITNNSIDTIFQHTVWTLTILVAITALITWTQKQIFFYRKKHPSKKVENKSIYDMPEEEDND